MWGDVERVQQGREGHHKAGSSIVDNEDIALLEPSKEPCRTFLRTVMVCVPHGAWSGQEYSFIDAGLTLVKRCPWGVSSLECADCTCMSSKRVVLGEPCPGHKEMLAGRKEELHRAAAEQWLSARTEETVAPVLASMQRFLPPE